MKKALLTLSLMLSFTMTALAQNVIQPDSVIIHYSRPYWMYYGDSTRVSWFFYDNEGLLIKGFDNFNYGFDFGNYIKRSDYRYDEHHNCTSMTKSWMELDCGEWVESVLNYQNNLLVNEQGTRVHWLAGGWGGTHDTTYLNTDYFYDDQNRLVEKLYSENNSPKNKISFEYIDPNQIGETFKTIASASEEWETLSHATKTYSDNGLLLNCLREQSNNPIRLTNYHYNNQERLTGLTTQKMINGEFVNEIRAVFDLNDDGMPITIRFEDWDGEKWIPGSSKLFYDIQISDLKIFNEDYLKRQENQLIDDGIEYMQFFYIHTAHPTYDVSEKPLINDIDIRPNPTKGTVAVTGEELQQVEVYNIMGQLILSEQSRGQSITLNLSSKPAGIYLINITDQNGKRCVKKVVKQ